MDTSHITLDESIQRLIEETARNIHEVWAAKRISEGWVWGAERNDGAKAHPCLVPYENLPESEREYDRATVTETLKAVFAQGYHLVPVSTPPPPETAPSTHQLFKHLASSDPIPLSELQKIWSRHVPEEWSTLPELYDLLAERIIKVGEPLLAYDVLSKGLQLFPKESSPSKNSDLFGRLRQLLGLSLAQSGAAVRARNVLQRLYDQGWKDGETLGILARTYKDLSLREIDPKVSGNLLKKAHDLYFEAYGMANENDRVDEAYYTGINAAALCLIRGEGKRARRLAHQVIEICEYRTKNPDEEDKTVSYWMDASIAEAHLIRGNFEEAIRFYRIAVKRAGYNHRDISAMKRQALWIAAQLDFDVSRLEAYFPLPRIAAFSTSRFPLFDSSEKWEGESLFKKKLQELDTDIGYVAITSEFDLAFAEAILDRPEAELHVVFPFSVQETAQLFSSNDYRQDWSARVESIARKATKCHELSYICELGNERNYEFANAFTVGMATLRGRWLLTDVKFLDAISLTMKKEGQSQGEEPQRLRRKPEDMKRYPREAARHIYAMMFADVKNYSQLDENQLLLFAHHFLRHTARTIQPYSSRLICKRTSGDGLFFVFDDLHAALDCALAFKDEVARISWAEHGLPASLTVRISLDAGPVFSYHDQVTDHTDFCGKYVIRAARMEPITPPGEIYTSESFAALAASRGLRQAEFAYVGRLPLPKNFGDVPIYHVRRTNN
jgi:class 3 adenylate cyclase